MGYFEYTGFITDPYIVFAVCKDGPDVRIAIHGGLVGHLAAPVVPEQAFPAVNGPESLLQVTGKITGKEGRKPDFRFLTGKPALAPAVERQDQGLAAVIDAHDHPAIPVFPEKKHLLTGKIARGDRSMCREEIKSFGRTHPDVLIPVFLNAADLRKGR